MFNEYLASRKSDEKPIIIHEQTDSDEIKRKD